ncbi:MAG: hypothetical protein CVU89_11720 [Firmicutes bacterium HGW-Firmicutes-14]|jgi:hypothetical protein|nr:MAG: hypothetical protein CVU89_11720 [Firmicutes bacterium HGW-Firmicutes-14]
MVRCPLRENCFLMSDAKLMPVLRCTIEKYYCNKANHTKCARFKLMQAGLPVPKTLLPNDKTCITAQSE